MQRNYLGKNRTPQELMSKYTPERQAVIARNPSKVYESDSPTLADMRAMYGGEWANFWLENQLQNLNEYVGCTKKMDVLQIEDTARVIIADSYFLKLSEVMLFLARLKAGRYGTFYGTVDPMTITTSLQTFKSERIQELSKIEDRKRDEARQAEDRSGTMNYLEWLAYKKQQSFVHGS